MNLLDGTKLHYTFASFMRVVTPDCDLSEDEQNHARERWVHDDVAIFSKNDELHVWVEQGAKPSLVAKALGGGLSDIIPEKEKGVGQSYADIAEAVYTLIEILHNAGRL